MKNAIMNELDETDKPEDEEKEKRADLADRLVNAMTSNLEKAMQMDDKERLRLEREREKPLDAILDEPLDSED